MNAKKKPDNSPLPFAEVKRRTLVHLKRIEMSRKEEAEQRTLAS